MKIANLCLHAGGKKVEREQVFGVVTPPETETWTPIPHHSLLQAVESNLIGSGFSVVAESHALAHEGDRYFGLLQVVNGHNSDDYGLVIGVRNSHDKAFPASLCLGSSVFVCDNLSFSGEVKLGRKHTKFINRDLPQVVSRAVGLLGDHRQNQDDRIAAYKNTGLSNMEANDFIIRALESRVIGTQAVVDVVKCWRTPPHPEFTERNCWSLFNAFTEVLKGNMEQAFKRTTALHGLMDAQCHQALAV